jgi:hypothetical protein
MCLYPTIILNRKYTKTKKNKGIIPQITDERTRYVPVGCGKCMECKKQKKRQWQVRLQEEIRHDNRGQFVTLSFNDEELGKLEKDYDEQEIITGIRKTITLKNGKERNYYNKEKIKTKNKLTGYELDNAVVKKAVRRFLERWRKVNKKSVKHWLVTELGQKKTERIHVHGILFTDKTTEEIEKIWKYGNVWIGEYTNERTINYIVKYVSKTDKQHPNYNSITLCSPGIGSNYIKRMDSNNNKYKGDRTNETYKTRQGIKLNLPIYYRNKIYTEEEREKLWIQKLDKGERWVNGVKIDISKTEEVYYKRLREAQIKSKKLGYQDNKKNWNKIKYENERRNLKKMERFAKLKSWGKKRKTN